MKRFILLILFALVNTPSWAVDYKDARRLQSEGEILPLEELVRKAQLQVPGRVIEVELDSDNSRLIYEIELLDDDGQVWEFKFDAKNGKLLEKELED